MTRGMFDPSSDNVLRGAGNSFLGDPGIERSKMPPNLVDGDVSAEEAAEAEANANTVPGEQPDVIDDEVRPTFDDDPEHAADNLMHIEVEDEGQIDIDDTDEPRQPE
jgi:hypothetical protein